MRFLGTLIVLASAGMLACAETNTTEKVRQLSLQECVELTLKHNLDLQIDRFNPEIALFTLKADYSAYDPNLNLAGQHDYTVQGTRLISGGFSVAGATTEDEAFSSGLNGLLPSGGTYSVGTGSSIRDTYGQTLGVPFENSGGSVQMAVNQPLLRNMWIDQPRLNIRVAKNRVKYTEQALRLQMMQTLTTLEQAFYDLIYSRENAVVQGKAVELAERLVAENRKRLEVGALAPLDLQSAEAQAASSRAGVIAAKSQLGTQERVLKQLVTDQYTAWSGLEIVPMGTLSAPAPVLNLQDSWSKGLAQRADLIQAKLDVERAGIQLKYTRNQLFPQLDIFGTAGYNGASTKQNGGGGEFSDALYDIASRNKPYYTYGGSLTFPLLNIGPRNNYKSAKASMEQIVLTLKKLEQTIMVAIDNDIGTIRANYDQVKATRAAREYEESALDAEQKKLESGKSTTYTVLQVQRDLTAARGSEIQALDTYNKSLSQLSLDEGTTLERLGVKLEWK
ncbi:MAG TPA: TolC family protein [Candidatus Dormibacteraeota bacterium]|nr:TolC family protein [Candidatus Dormibacteraeota bacterium]